jgi:hypothetical protein
MGNYFSFSSCVNVEEDYNGRCEHCGSYLGEYYGHKDFLFCSERCIGKYDGMIRRNKTKIKEILYHRSKNRIEVKEIKI